MLQRWTNTKPYAQPVQLLAQEGKRYVLPKQLVDGLSFLSPFVKRKGNPVEQWVHLINGNLFVVTNSLIQTFKINANSLPDLKFSAKAIGVLSAFEEAPTHMLIDDDVFYWEWQNSQQLQLSCSHAGPVSFGDQKPINDARASAIEKYWGFTDGIVVQDETRKTLRRSLSASKLHRDVYVTSGCVASRMKNLKGSNDDTYVHIDDFENNAFRTMRFDRQAFLGMIRVASEIDFTCSPVCFRHQNGRGLLVEKTLGSDIPDLEFSDD